MAWLRQRATVLACASAMLLLPLLSDPTLPAEKVWREDFSAGVLDPRRWQQTLAGDTRAIDVNLVPQAQGPGFRLRLAVDTRGTSDHTVKHVGIVTRCALVLGSKANVIVNLDWGPPANGSYLSAALVLSPHFTRGDPTSTPNWLSVGYVGVPPGRTARLLVRTSTSGIKKTLYQDGWPDKSRHGRGVTEARLELVLRDSAFELHEDDRLVPLDGRVPEHFDRVYLYLQLSSHSNYPLRAVHFSELHLIQGDGTGGERKFPSAPSCTQAA